MPYQDEIEYHSSRAAQELNQSILAGTGIASRVHLSLSSLHRKRAQELQSYHHSASPAQLVEAMLG